MISTYFRRSPGPRLKRHRRAAARKRLIAGVAGLFSLLAAAALAGEGTAFLSSLAGGGAAVKGTVVGDADRGPFLILDDKMGDVALLKPDREGGASFLRIQANVITDSSQVEPETIGNLVDVGLQAVIRGAEDVTGTKVPRYLVLKDERLSELEEADQLVAAVRRAPLTNLSFSERGRLVDRLSRLEPGALKLYWLPARSVRVGDRVYLEPRKRSIAELIKDVWDVNSSARVSVIVLNGSGNPGVARLVASSLEEAGFEVIAVKNADNFDYIDTRVLVYNQPEAGKDLVGAIGVGKIIEAKFRPKSIDIAVVVGRDYTPRP